MCHRILRIVVQGIGGNNTIALNHFHIIIEHGFACLGVILAPIGHQLLVLVGERTTLKEVGIVVKAVVIKAIGVECLPPMFEPNILTSLHHLCLTIVKSSFAGERERVALHHSHVTKGTKRVCLLVKVCTITPHSRSFVHELHLPFHNLSIGNRAELVVAQLIRVHQIHAVVGLCCGFHLFLSNRGQQTEYKKA